MAIHKPAAGTRVAVRVAPRASHSEILGWEGDVVRVRIAAPPVDGKANDALIRLLAEALHVPTRRVTVVAGAGSRTKLVEIEGIDAVTVVRLLGRDG